MDKCKIDPNCHIGQSAKFGLTIASGATNTILINQDFIFNEPTDNDTKIKINDCCDREFFIKNRNNTAEIFLGLRGMYLFLFESQSPAIVGNAVSIITERESRSIPLSTGNSGFVLIYNNEEKMTARIRNTGLASIVETQSTIASNDVHSVTIVYLGTGRR